MESVLGQLVEGAWTIEPRMMLEVRLLPGGDEARRADPPRAQRGGRGARVAWRGWCGWRSTSTPRTWRPGSRDGLVVSSPTGSTGYSFSAGGPILDPTSRNLVVTSVAAYLSAVRTFVVSPAHSVHGPGAGRLRLHGQHRRPRGHAAARRATRCGSAPASSPSGSSSRAAPSRSGSCCDARPSCCRPEMALLELSVTDLALIERVRVPARRGPDGHHRRDRRRQVAAHRCPGAREGGRADASLVRAGASVGAGGGAVRPAGRSSRVTRTSRSSVSASWPRPAAPSPASTTRRSPSARLAAIGRAARRDPRPARAAAAAVGAAGSATCSMPTAATPGVARRSRTAVAAWRANRDALAALEMAPERAGTAPRRWPGTWSTRSTRVDPRPGEVDELRARLARAHRRRTARSAWRRHPRRSLVGEGSGVQDQAGAGAPRCPRPGTRRCAPRAAGRRASRGWRRRSVDIADEVRQAAGRPRGRPGRVGTRWRSGWAPCTGCCASTARPRRPSWRTRRPTADGGGAPARARRRARRPRAAADGRLRAAAEDGGARP